MHTIDRQMLEQKLDNLASILSLPDRTHAALAMLRHSYMYSSSYLDLAEKYILELIQED